MEAAARGRVDAALRFCRFRCACRVEELGNLNISERHPPPCVTKGDQIKGSLDSLKVMDKSLMDSYRRSLSEHTKCRPSLALSATASWRCFEDLLGIFQL